MRFLSSKTHTIIGLITGVILLLAPYIFMFTENSAATSVTMAVGVFIILSELITTSRFSPIKLIPMRVHLVLDYLTGIFLAVSPWLFGFASVGANAWVPHLIVGIFVVAYAAVTNPRVDVDESKM